MATNYQKLTLKLEEISRLGGIMGILHWDQEVIMPSGAAESRAKQMGALAGIIHEKSTDPEIGNLLEKINQENSFNNFEECNINEARRQYELETKLPKNLVMKLAELSSKGHQIWVKARSENRFSDFVPVLTQLIELKKKHFFVEKSLFENCKNHGKSSKIQNIWVWWGSASYGGVFLSGPQISKIFACGGPRKPHF